MKKTLFIVLVFIFSISMIGCGKVSNSTVKKDFQSYIGADKELTELKIVKSAKENSQYYANISVVYNDDYYQMQETYDVFYYKYSEGWMLEYISADEQATWTITPIKGVSEELIINSLTNQNLYFDSIEYDVTEIDSSSINILSQVTASNYLTDTLSLSYSFEDDYINYNAEVNATFNFYNNTWNLDELETTNLTYTLKPEYSFNKTVDDLLADFSTKSYFERTFLSITELEILDSYLDASSLKYVINTASTMNYDIATIHVNITFSYVLSYNNAWKINDITLNNIISYENDLLSGTYYAIDGDRYKYERELTLALDTNEFGLVTGTANVTYYNPYGYVMSYSYYLKGKINFPENQINIDVDEWIIAPAEPYNGAPEVITYTFNSDDNSLINYDSYTKYNKTN